MKKGTLAAGVKNAVSAPCASWGQSSVPVALLLSLRVGSKSLGSSLLHTEASHMDGGVMPEGTLCYNTSFSL